MTLTVGKLRRIQQCATPDGFFVIMALDHRNNLRRALNPSNPDNVSYDDMVRFKRQVVRALSPVSSAVLLDPEFGAAPCVTGGSLPGQVGLMVAVEATGYTDEPTARRSQILDGWGVEKIARMGASAVKMLLYYHPEARNAAEQEDLVREVAQMCRDYDMPFFLEPLSFPIDPAVKKLSSAAKRDIVLETARRLSPLGIDVLKAEFPLDTAEEPDERVWQAACRELEEASHVPWVLLSAGVGFDEFERQTQIACEAGCSGVMAGRAVWQEAVDARGNERQDILDTTGVERMVRLGDVISQYGQPWQERYPTPVEMVDEHWYIRY